MMQLLWHMFKVHGFTHSQIEGKRTGALSVELFPLHVCHICPFTLMDLLIPAWIIKYIHYKVWNQITYLLPNLIGAAAGVWEWVSNFILHFIEHGVNYPCRD